MHALAGQDFSGIGLIVHSRGVSLPIFPLRIRTAPPASSDLEQTLAGIASIESDLHDGFHLISTDWQITAVAQYFSPPILADAEINWTRKFGGRYLAAQFGSAIPGVELCGIATNSIGLVIFRSGREVRFEKL